MRQYMLSLPDEVLDAARIDGASELEIYWRIVHPAQHAGDRRARDPRLRLPVEQLSLAARRRPLIQDVDGAGRAEQPAVYASSARSSTCKWRERRWRSCQSSSSFLLQRYFVHGIALTGMKG